METADPLSRSLFPGLLQITSLVQQSEHFRVLVRNTLLTDLADKLLV